MTNFRRFHTCTKLLYNIETIIKCHQLFQSRLWIRTPLPRPGSRPVLYLEPTFSFLMLTRLKGCKAPRLSNVPVLGFADISLCLDSCCTFLARTPGHKVSVVPSGVMLTPVTWCFPFVIRKQSVGSYFEMVRGYSVLNIFLPGGFTFIGHQLSTTLLVWSSVAGQHLYWHFRWTPEFASGCQWET